MKEGQRSDKRKVDVNDQGQRSLPVTDLRRQGLASQEQRAAVDIRWALLYLLDGLIVRVRDLNCQRLGVTKWLVLLKFYELVKENTSWPNGSKSCRA